MKFRSADHAAREYLRMRDELASPKTQQLTVSAGWDVAEKCPHCHSIESFIGAEKTTKERVLRCFKCKRQWPVEPVEVPRQGMGGGRGGALEERLAELGTLTAQLERLDVWRRRVLLTYATGRFSLQTLAGECFRRWPRRIDPWTQHRVRCDLDDAREDLEGILRRAGMLDQ